MFINLFSRFGLKGEMIEIEFSLPKLRSRSTNIFCTQILNGTGLNWQAEKTATNGSLNYENISKKIWQSELSLLFFSIVKNLDQMKADIVAKQSELVLKIRYCHNSVCTILYILRKQERE